MTVLLIVIVDPLLYVSVETVPAMPCVIGSELELSAVTELGETSFVLNANPNGLVWTVLFCMRSFQIIRASQPSLLRSAPEWSATMKSPPPFLTKFRIAVFSVAVNLVFGSHTMKAW